MPQKWKDLNPDQKKQRHRNARKAWLKYRYGMTPDELEAIIREQAGRCRLCKRLPTGKRGCAKLHIDHCHTTGKVRGLLCHNCNKAIGHLRDDPELALAVAEYLKEHNRGSGQ